MTPSKAVPDRLHARGQSSVVGVAVLLGATVIALGILTASVGTLVDGQVARGDAQRVASRFDETLRPESTTGYDSVRVSFTDGSLESVERDLRLFDTGGQVAHREIGGLVFEHGDQRAAFVAGAVVRGSGGNAWLVRDPSIVASGATDVLVVGAPILGETNQQIGGDHASARLAINVSHDRREFASGQYRVAIETATPEPLERYFESASATTDRRDIDDDGVPSVIATYPGSRTAYLVDHHMRLEVTDG